MRPIDADLLQRRICGAKCGCEYEDCGNEGDCEYNHFISNAPIIDAVPVVRCRECKHIGFCGDATNLEVMGFYGYCSRGERKEGADNDT